MHCRFLSNGFEFPIIDNITKESYNTYKKLRQGTKNPHHILHKVPRPQAAGTGGFSDDFYRDRPVISTRWAAWCCQELRRTFGISADTPLEILTEGDAILLRKYRPADACALCGEVAAGSVQLHGKYVCPACRQALTGK